MHHDATSHASADSDRTEFAKARGAALRLLALRSRTVAEMKEKLSRNFGNATVELTVTRLEEEGLLNDALFAQRWRESRDRKKPRSSRMIAAELLHKGVSAENIESALQDFDSQSAAYRAAARYAARQSGKDRTAFERRVGAFLARRGFQPGIIRDTVRQLREELGVGETGESIPAVE